MKRCTVHGTLFDALTGTCRGCAMRRPGWYRQLDEPFGRLVRWWHLAVVAQPITDDYAPGGDTLQVGWERVIDATGVAWPDVVTRPRRRSDRRPGGRWHTVIGARSTKRK